MAKLELSSKEELEKILLSPEYKEFMEKSEMLTTCYKAREFSADEKPFTDINERESNLNALAELDISDMKSLEEKINEMAAIAGLSFDSKTGELTSVKDDAKNDRNAPLKGDALDSKSLNPEELEKLASKMDEKSDEYERIQRYLIDDGGISEQNTKQRNLRMERDVEAKRMLEQRAKLEKIKEMMDMHIARHVAERNKLMNRIDKLKLDILRETAKGVTPDQEPISGYRKEISGIASQISSLDATFNAAWGNDMTVFASARSELEETGKSIETTSSELNAMRTSKNNLRTYDLYNEDGIKCGRESDGRADDRNFEEKEVIDPRGVLIFGVNDIISNVTTVNVEGTVVRITNDAASSTSDLSINAYVDNVEQLNIDTLGDGSTVEQKPDINRAVENKEIEGDEEINGDRNLLYEIGGKAYLYGMLPNDPDERRRAAIALGMIGARSGSPVSIAAKALAAMRDAYNMTMDEFEFTPGGRPPIS